MLPFHPLGNANGLIRKSRSYGHALALIAPLLAISLIVGTLTFQMLRTIDVEAIGGDKPTPLPGTISPLLRSSQLSGIPDPQQKIALSIGLRPRRQAELLKQAQDLAHPRLADPQHAFAPVTQAQYATLFSPTEASYTDLAHFLTGAGFTITRTYSHRLLIDFSGTIEQAERAFNIKLSLYKGRDGRSYYANDDDPRLPPKIARDVLGINGLNNALRWKHSLAFSHTTARQAINLHAKNKCPTAGKGYLLPSQIASAYNLSPLQKGGQQGQGQTIALFELDTFVQKDLDVYTACFGGTRTVIQSIVTGQTPIIPDEGMMEVHLDAGTILSTAPKLSRLKIYEAANNAPDYLAEWAQIVQDAPPIVATSWGMCEHLLDPAVILQENVLLASAVLQGQNIFAASGDSGSTGCLFNDGNSTLSAIDPASQPFVTSVGGSTLKLTPSGSYKSESVWNNWVEKQSERGGASGGGISQYWQLPSWQKGPAVNNAYSTGKLCNAPAKSMCRETPDVAFHADPHSGYLVHCTIDVLGCSQSPWMAVGGTSAAAPMWAAWLALTNQLVLKQGGNHIGILTPFLYQIASDAKRYKTCFHDITAGTNDIAHLNHGSYPATSGYDLATGLGSYNGYELAKAVIALAQQQAGPRATPGSTTWYFAEGSIGGGFQEFLSIFNPHVDQDARLSVTYLFQKRAPVTIAHLVPRGSHISINVNTDLNVKPGDKQQSLSAIVRVIDSGPGIVVERPMSFTFEGIKSGSNALGATKLAKTYYFPNVDSRQSEHKYKSYLSILNPNSKSKAHITVTYYTGSCGQSGQDRCPEQSLDLAPQQRGTLTPLAIPLYLRSAVKVSSDQAIVVERPTYFSDTIFTLGGSLTGASSLVGASKTANQWYFAEGNTGKGQQEYLVLANFADTTTKVHINLYYAASHSQQVELLLPALGQYFLDVNQANTNPSGSCDSSPCQITTTNSIEVLSDAPIVAERLSYMRSEDKRFAGASETLGESGPASHNAYIFAEGNVSDAYQEGLAILNPTTKDEMVAVTLFANSYIYQQNFLVKALDRQSIVINDLLTELIRKDSKLGTDSYRVSMQVQTLQAEAKIIAERSIFYNVKGVQGTSIVIGFGNA